MRGDIVETIDTKQFEVGSVNWQNAMTHNIFVRLKNGKRLTDEVKKCIRIPVLR